MSFILQPWQFLLIVLAGWINRDQQAAIEYLRAENWVLNHLVHDPVSKRKRGETLWKTFLRSR